MNYQNIYTKLVTRGQAPRDLAYFEVHHIVPRCLGGSNDQSNLTNLTPEEHYIAHLCLIKMHPGHMGLVKAAVMMCCDSKTTQRPGNKIYGWLRKKHSAAMSLSQAGEKNSQYGKVWITSADLTVTKKVSKNEIDMYLSQGWVRGRATSRDFYQVCEVCNTAFRNSFKKKTCSAECDQKNNPIFAVFKGREQEFLDLYALHGSMNKALKAMGFKGAVSHYYRWAKTLVEQSCR